MEKQTTCEECRIMQTRRYEYFMNREYPGYLGKELKAKAKLIDTLLGTLLMSYQKDYPIELTFDKVIEMVDDFRGKR